MKLIKSQVVFNQELHIYTLNGVQLQGITGMIGRQLFSNKYANVPRSILAKAANRGSFIHEVCELTDDLGVSHESEEARNYSALKELHGLQYETSEYLVSDNEYFASCIDKVYRESESEFSLGDIKTTNQLDIEYVRWQLSIYAYLFEMQNPGSKVIRLFAIWLRGNIHELVEVERIPDNVIVNLMAAEISGLQFVNPYSVSINSNNLPAKYQEMEQSIIKINEQVKYWTDKKKELTEGVMKEMVSVGVYNWIGKSISFIRRKDSIRNYFDMKAFERDHPDLYKEYLKETPVVGTVTLKVL